MRLLVTRPEPGATATTLRLRTLGHDVVSDPLLTIAATEAPLPAGPFDALAFTSLNGVRALAARDRPDLALLPAFAVGSRTAEEARTHGFARVVACDGEVESLARRIAATLPQGTRLLHAAGADRAGDLPGLLAPHQIHVTVSVLYAAVCAERLGAASRAALAAGQLDAVLHFSPRTAKALLHCVAAEGLGETLRPLRHLCLSQAVAAPLAQAGLATEVAEAPAEDALLRLL